MIVLSTSASSGDMTRSLSSSVLEGAICSSGTSSPLAGRRYWTRLWWDSSVSSSILMPAARRTSMAAQAQKALSSSLVRSRRLPVPGSSAQMRGEYRDMRARLRVWPPAVNSSPGAAAMAARSRAAAASRARPAARGTAGRGDVRGQAERADARVMGLQVLPEAQRQRAGQARQGVVVNAGLALAQVVREQVTDGPAGQIVAVH